MDLPFRVDLPRRGAVVAGTGSKSSLRGRSPGENVGRRVRTQRHRRGGVAGLCAPAPAAIPIAPLQCQRRRGLNETSALVTSWTRVPLRAPSRLPRRGAPHEACGRERHARDALPSRGSPYRDVPLLLRGDQQHACDVRLPYGDVQPLSWTCSASFFFVMSLYITSSESLDETSIR